MLKTKFFYALASGLLVVAISVGCAQKPAPRLLNPAFAECLASVTPIPFTPYPTTAGSVGIPTLTAIPTRTTQPDAILPDKVIIQSGDAVYRGGFRLDREWILEDSAQVARIYCGTLNLPNKLPQCPKLFGYKQFVMNFMRGDRQVDLFYFSQAPCARVTLELDPQGYAQGNFWSWSGTEERFTTDCYWLGVADAMNMSLSELMAPTKFQIAEAAKKFVNPTERMVRATKHAQLLATSVAEETGTAVVQLTRTNTPSDEVMTRSARGTRRAQTETRTPTQTETSTPEKSSTPENTLTPLPICP